MGNCFQCNAATERRTSPTTAARYPERTHICSICSIRNLENGIGMKLVPVGDGCEWNPEANLPALEGEAHTSSTPAAVIVGAQGEWRLCAECAALPRFRRYRKRKPVVRKGVPNAHTP